MKNEIIMREADSNCVLYHKNCQGTPGVFVPSNSAVVCMHRKVCLQESYFDFI